MEIIGVILMIIFALVSASERNKKKGAGQAGRTNAQGIKSAGRATANPVPANRMSPARRQARMDELRQKQAERAAQRAADAPVMPSNAASTFESSLTALKELLDVAQVEPAEGGSMLADEACAGGSMPHSHAEGASRLEDEECAGGSMPHSHTEGVSRAAQARRLNELDHQSGPDAEGRERLIPDAVDARALRRAVVMAEVLGRPKALKRA